MIPREIIKKLKKIEIYTSRLANDQLAGSYHSVFKGRGMTFSEVRQYQPGDDVRFIDWNVSARMSEAYVKVFTEEREMTWRSPIFDRWVRISSVTPSLKNSFPGSSLMLVNGSTAIEGLSGKAGEPSFCRIRDLRSVLSDPVPSDTA